MAADATPWLAALRRYLVASALGHAAWETLQLPLYTIWFEGTAAQVAFAVAHCTGGDLLIAVSTLVAALIVFGRGWPGDRAAFRNVALAAVALGLAYTVYSEWLNVDVRGTWTYSQWMPRLPPLGTGLSPLMQWVVVPLLSFAFVRRAQAGPP
jgi:hypothetical protein